MTSKSKQVAGGHTPGPWTTDLYDSPGFNGIPIFGRITDPTDGYVMCPRIVTVETSYACRPPAVSPMSREEAEANARLITAAPELLSTLDQLAKACERGAFDLEDAELHANNVILYADIAPLLRQAAEVISKARAGK